MSDYTKLTNFTAKDSLPSGNPGKVIKGTDFDSEFDAIATAVATKANIASPSLTGTPTAPTASSGTTTTQIATTAFVGAAVASSSGTALPLTGGTLTGLVNLFTSSNKLVALGTSTVNLSLGEVFSYTLPSAQTFVFSNPIATASSSSGFVLQLTNGGAFAVTWPASVDWPSGTAPTLTAAGVDVLVFVTLDNGTTWRGVLAIKDSK